MLPPFPVDDDSHDYAVDERLVMPETRFEILDGEVLHVSPAEPPHASRHSKLQALLETHVAAGFDAACDMLTRTGEKSDFAPDGSIYPEAPDPVTGGRQIEQLAFEVLSTQTIANAGRKAKNLTARGVRRVFAIDVERQRALEWSTTTDAWDILANTDAIDDPTLVTPLPIAALVGAAALDDAIAHALLVKGNPVIQAVIAQGEAQGEARGQAQGEARGQAQGEARGRLIGKLEALIEVRFGALDEPTRQRIAGATNAELERALSEVGTVTDPATLWR